jgi:hypothetical protein
VHTERRGAEGQARAPAPRRTLAPGPVSAPRRPGRHAAPRPSPPAAVALAGRRRFLQRGAGRPRHQAASGPRPARDAKGAPCPGGRARARACWPAACMPPITPHARPTRVLHSPSSPQTTRTAARRRFWSGPGRPAGGARPRGWAGARGGARQGAPSERGPAYNAALPAAYTARPWRPCLGRECSHGTASLANPVRAGVCPPQPQSRPRPAPSRAPRPLASAPRSQATPADIQRAAAAVNAIPPLARPRGRRRPPARPSGAHGAARARRAGHGPVGPKRGAPRPAGPTCGRLLQHTEFSPHCMQSHLLATPPPPPPATRQIGLADALLPAGAVARLLRALDSVFSEEWAVAEVRGWRGAAPKHYAGAPAGRQGLRPAWLQPAAG